MFIYTTKEIAYLHTFAYSIACLENACVAEAKPSNISPRTRCLVIPAP